MSLKNYPLEKLVPFIDWAPFFQTWDLAGKYPDILQDPVVGEAARNVLKEGQAMLDRVVKGRWITASGVFGLWPANAVGDDIEIYADDKRERVLMTWHNLRQQNQKPPGNPNQCLSDFVAPKDSGVADYLGAFAVTSGIAPLVAFLSTATRSLRRGATSGASAAVGSFGSAPAIAARTISASRALRVIGPSLSSVQQSAIAPWRETRP